MTGPFETVADEATFTFTTDLLYSSHFEQLSSRPHSQETQTETYSRHAACFWLDKISKHWRYDHHCRLWVRYCQNEGPTLVQRNSASKSRNVMLQKYRHQKGHHKLWDNQTFISITHSSTGVKSVASLMPFPNSEMTRYNGTFKETCCEKWSWRDLDSKLSSWQSWRSAGAVTHGNLWPD